MDMGEGGVGRGAHGGCRGGFGVLGEAPERAQRRRGSPTAGDEDDEDGDDAGPPAPCNSVERTRKMRRSFWAARGGEGEAMAAVVLVGGGGRIR